MSLPGFDSEFSDLDHYIRVITDRIWEGRRLQDINRYYSADCVVETPMGISRGIAPVVQGTQETLHAFPDRRLLAEEIAVSGDSELGYLSSHRIVSPMTHLGGGRFGAATGKPVLARTIADCVCHNNRIVHEWLVRDQAAIARQIGSNEQEMARRWLAAQPNWEPPSPTVSPAPYKPELSQDPLALTYRQAFEAQWQQRDFSATATLYDEAAQVAVPGGETVVGWQGIGRFWLGLCSSIPNATLQIDQLAVQRRPERNPLISVRWRVFGSHSGHGRYADPTGQPLNLLGISHAEFAGPRVIREWLLLDEVAIWMQIFRRQEH